MKNNSRKKRIMIAMLIILVVIFAANYYAIRSFFVMSIYSQFNLKNSVMRKQDFELNLKGGLSTSKKDWYPFINVYDTSSEFSDFTGRNLDLTVIYNFGALNKGSSFLYDEKSEYFSAFYGAYVVKDNDSDKKTYGFNNGILNIDEITEVALFDYKYLVIQDLGCNNPVFEVLESSTEYSVDYIGHSDWVRIDAKMLANSPSHKRKEFMLGYIQYGRPHDNGKEDFFEIELFGRMYARYFKEYDCTVVIYVIGAEESTINECDTQILSKTEIMSKEN